MLPIYIEAEYGDGFVHVEDEQDRSLYEEGRNVFYDILNRLPEAEHGKMIRFSLVNLSADERIDVDFTVLPDNARPIRFKHMQGDFENDGLVASHVIGIDFGYQFTDANGDNQQEVVEVR